MQHHAQYGIVGGAGLDVAAIAVLIVGAASGWEPRWMILALAGFAAASLAVAVSVGLLAMARMRAQFTSRVDGLGMEHGHIHQRIDGVEQRMDTQVIETYSLGVAHGSLVSSDGDARMG